MPGESGQVIAGIVVAKVVQQEEGIEFFRFAESERAFQFYAGALDRGLCFNDLLDRT